MRRVEEGAARQGLGVQRLARARRLSAAAGGGFSVRAGRGGTDLVVPTRQFGRLG
jgi:hypothetical protein